MHSSPPSQGFSGGAVRLSDWGLIRATGADVRSFLHGQLTQDLANLPPDTARLAGYCSPKGRLLASFVVWATGPEELLLACSADLLPQTLSRLSMFVLRAKCRLSDASADIQLWGLAGSAAEQWLGPSTPKLDWGGTTHDGGQVIRLPAALVETKLVPRWLLALPTAAEQPAIDSLPLPTWHALEACSGVVRVTLATREQFVPQMVNLELAGGVSFSKGCYPGQEVVARSQYRGTLKRRAFLATSDAAMSPGQEIFSVDDPDQPAGMVALAGTFGAGRYDALVELKLQAARGAALRLGSAGGAALRLEALPYEVPLDAG